MSIRDVTRVGADSANSTSDRKSQAERECAAVGEAPTALVSWCAAVSSNLPELRPHLSCPGN